MNWSENKNKFYFIIIVVLIIIILLQKCGGKDIGKIPIGTNDTIRDTSWVTVTKEIPTYIPKWKTKIEYVHDTTKVIDTAYVIGDYYSTYYYQDSLIEDSTSIYIYDSISQNKIKSRNIKYKSVRPIITNTVIKNKYEFYYGVGLVGSQNGINYFGPEFLLRTKNKNAYGIGLGIDGNLQPNLSLRAYWKIGKK
jgi:hypothetical protein